MPRKAKLIKPLKGTFNQVVEALLYKNDKNIIKKQKKITEKKGN